MVKIEVRMNDGNTMGIKITTPLMRTYYRNFHGMITNSNEKPEGMTIIKKALDSVEITIPAIGGVNLSNPTSDDSELPNMSPGFSPDMKKNINYVIDMTQRFCMAAVKTISKKTEFCPILDFSGGYSFDQLKEDVLLARDNKRDYLIIDSYKSYLKGMKEHDYKFNEYRIPYGTSEYCDFLLLVENSKLDEIKKIYKNKLKPTNWF